MNKLSKGEMIGLNVNQLGRMNLMFAAWVTQRTGGKYIISDVGATATLDPELYVIKGEGKVVGNFRVCSFMGCCCLSRRCRIENHSRCLPALFCLTAHRIDVSELPLTLFHWPTPPLNKYLVSVY